MSRENLSRRTFLGLAAMSTGAAATVVPQVVRSGQPIGGYGWAASGSQRNERIIFHPRSPEDHTMEGFPPSKAGLVTLDNCEATQQKTGWTHRHVRDLVPTHVVRRGGSPVCMLPVQPADVRDLRVPDKTDDETTVAEWLRQSEASAFRVRRATGVGSGST